MCKGMKASRLRSPQLGRLATTDPHVPPNQQNTQCGGGRGVETEGIQNFLGPEETSFRELSMPVTKWGMEHDLTPLNATLLCFTPSPWGCSRPSTVHHCLSYLLCYSPILLTRWDRVTGSRQRALTESDRCPSQAEALQPMREPPVTFLRLSPHSVRTEGLRQGAFPGPWLPTRHKERPPWKATWHHRESGLSKKQTFISTGHWDFGSVWYHRFVYNLACSNSHT